MVRKLSILSLVLGLPMAFFLVGCQSASQPYGVSGNSERPVLNDKGRPVSYFEAPNMR